VKSRPFLNAGCIMYSISIFIYFTFYLFGGSAYAPNAPPLPTSLDQEISRNVTIKNEKQPKDRNDVGIRRAAFATRRGYG